MLATPGVVNPKSGAIEMAPNITGLDHLNVVGLLSEKLGTPVVFENDINLALLGEIWHGCAQNVANVAFLALGSGVGLGLYVNGRLVRGENGAAGEIGYLPIGGDPLQAESACRAASSTRLAQPVSCGDTGRPAVPMLIRRERFLSARRRATRLPRMWSTRRHG